MIKTIFLYTTGISLLISILLTWVGFEHNPQGAFVDLETGAIAWGYALKIFGISFLAFDALLFVGSLLIAKMCILWMRD